MKKPTVLALFAATQFCFTQGAMAQQSAAPAAQKGIASLFTKSSEDELIEPDLAFRLKVTAKGPTTLVAEVIPAKGYYLYKDKIRFTTAKDSGVTVTGLKFPKGEVKVDQTFGKTEVFRIAVPVEVALQRTAQVKTVALTASYQGCHEKLGVCYPPIDKTVNVALP